MLKFSLKSITALLISGVALSLAASEPTTLSPGETDRYAVSENPCPLFSWAATDEAEDYELRIMPAEADKGNTPVFQVRLPGGSRAWQPPLGNCLEYGGKYNWSIRELSGSWGRPLLFQIVQQPSAAAVSNATEVLETWLKAKGSEFEESLKARVGDPLPTFTIAPDVTGISTTGSTSGGPQVSFGVHAVEPSAVQDSAGAVGESLSATGNVGGVIGQVASPDGIAAVFENNGGGSILEARTPSSVGLTIDNIGNVFAFSYEGKGTGLTGVMDLACSACVDGSEIVDFAVDSSLLADNSVGFTKIATGAVSTGKFALGAVEAEAIASGAVTAVKISEDAVTFSKLADGAVGSSEIASNAVTGVHFRDGTLVRSNFQGAEKKVYSIHSDCPDTGKATLQAQCNSDVCQTFPSAQYLNCSGACSAGSPVSCVNDDAGWLLSPTMDP